MNSFLQTNTKMQKGAKMRNIKLLA